MPPADEKSFRHAGRARAQVDRRGLACRSAARRPLVLNGSVTYHEAAPTALVARGVRVTERRCRSACRTSSTPKVALVDRTRTYFTCTRIRTACSRRTRRRSSCAIWLSPEAREQRRDVDGIAADVAITRDLAGDCRARRPAGRVGIDVSLVVEEHDDRDRSSHPPRAPDPDPPSPARRPSPLRCGWSHWKLKIVDAGLRNPARGPPAAGLRDARDPVPKSWKRRIVGLPPFRFFAGVASAR